MVNDQNQTQSEEKTVEIKNEEVIEKKEDSVETKVESNSDSNENFEEMLNESFEKFQQGEIIDGTVVRIEEKDVFVDIGRKSEAPIPIKEFNEDNMPEKGDIIKLYIESASDIGHPRLSKRKADFIVNLPKLKEIMGKGESIKGKFKRRIKGGMIVEIMDLEAFLPGSQISLKPIPNLDQFIGKEKEFKILSIDEQKRSVVVSRKELLKEEEERKIKELKEKLKTGAELLGEVRNITDYGAFIDLGGIDGLLHITDMSWGHIKHPSDILNIGDKIKVKVLQYDPEENKVSLGMKQLVPHPWERVEQKYPEGSIVTGRVVNLTKYGAFVELEPGVEGLVHVSELSWTKKIKNPKQVLKVGENIKAIVLNVSREDRRISLGIKQMEPNPWLTLEERYPEGSVIKVKVKNVLPFGIFCEIEDDIEGMIHISDISWTKRIYNPRKLFKKGDEIEVKILHIDKALHRIALGIKQLKPDPWESLDEKLPINRELTAKIVKIIPKGVLVDVPVDDDFVEGFVPLSHLAVPGLTQAKDAFEVGEELPLKIIELDLENRRLILSVKAYFFAKGKEKMDEYLKVHLERLNKSKESKDKEEKTAEEVKETPTEEPKEEKTEEAVVEDTNEAKSEVKEEVKEETKEDEPATEETHEETDNLVTE